ncbi:DUF2080 family transposase-associated protein [Candidatus Pacearchaeota archaeon]|nr:DUF2080 family transposase-associated protein [Candidatus Pacearchaeota archaeon]
MPDKTNQRIFNKRAIPVGNSAGVLLPKSLLGANVKVLVINSPLDVKKDTFSILSPILDSIVGAYMLESSAGEIKILAVSSDINRHIERGIYKIEVVSLQMIKKLITNKNPLIEKILNSTIILNKNFLETLKKGRR